MSVLLCAYWSFYKINQFINCICLILQVDWLNKFLLDMWPYLDKVFDHRLDDANKLFDEMCERGLLPNDVTFTTGL